MSLPQALFFSSKKTCPWIFGACILWMLSIFIDFRVPPSTPWSMSLPQALFVSQKTRPWIFGACILWILSIFIDFRVPQVVPAQNDADDDDGNEPTTAMPHSHQQANAHTQGPNIPFRGYPLTLIISKDYQNCLEPMKPMTPMQQMQ